MQALARVARMRVDLRHLVAFLLAAYAAIVLLAHSWLGSNYFVDIRVIGQICLLVTALVAFLYLSPASALPHVYVVCFFFGLFVLVRLGQLVIAPSGSVSFPLPPYNGPQLQSALWQVLFGTVAFLLGIVASARIPFRESAPAVRNLIKPAKPRRFLVGIAVVWLAGYVASAVVLWHDSSIFITGYNQGSAVGWLVRLLDPDAVLIIAIVFLVRSRDLSQAQFTGALALIALWVVFSTIGGSRGGALRIGTVAFFALIALMPARPISPVRLIGWAVLIGALSIPTALLGQWSRYWQAGAPDALAVSMRESTAEKQAEFIERHRRAAQQREMEVDAEEARLAQLLQTLERSPVDSQARQRLMDEIERAKSKLPSLIAVASQYPPDKRAPYDAHCLTSVCRAYHAMVPILQRLGMIDYAVYTLAGRPDQQVVDQYLRSAYAAQRIVNAAVPGTIFEGLDISTVQAVGMAFRNTGAKHAYENYSSEPWTLWGYAKLVFGPAAGMISIFLAGFVLQLAFSVVSLAPQEVRDLARTSFLFLVTYRVIDFFGPDHFAMVIIHYGIALSTTYVLVIVIAALLDERKAGRLSA